MLLPEHKFLVKEVFDTAKTNNEKHTFKRIILVKPGYTNEFSEKVGKDDIYDCRAWNQTIEQLPSLAKGDKVKALLNLNGHEVIDTNGHKYWTIQLTIRKLEKLK